MYSPARVPLWRVGDTVKITSKKRGFQYHWIREMDCCLGKIGIVERIEPIMSEMYYQVRVNKNPANADMRWLFLEEVLENGLEDWDG